MEIENIKRGLRAEIKRRENEQYFTFQCNVRQMCKDVLAKLEEPESVIAELRAQIVQADSECADALKQLKELKKLNARLRHQKYKRCLANAKLCGYAYATEERDGFWLKWWTRWQELAKNFKEV